MAPGKSAYLKRLTEKVNIPSVKMDREMEGSTPPSVFIGSYNYPKVLAGPMIAPVHGDTAIMDSCERWIPEGKSQEEIIDYRMNLVRGKRSVGVTDLNDRLVEKLQEISLSSGSVESEAGFHRAPRGRAFSEDHAPFGPSALLERFETDIGRWDRLLEKTFYDTDWKAAGAVEHLYHKGVPFSSIQKAFSTGTMGVGRNRRLVPTRWSITACDTAIADHLLREVRHHEVIGTYQVREFSSLNNRYAVLLVPTPWQYEWMEAFLHVMGREELIFSDHETNREKKGYSIVGGCYYSCKMAVLEGLARERKQAGAIVLREAYHGYVPLGVFNVRENVRSAMEQPPLEFEDLRGALGHIFRGFKLPLSRFLKESTLLKDLFHARQTTLSQFFS